MAITTASRRRPFRPPGPTALKPVTTPFFIVSSTTRLSIWTGIPSISTRQRSPLMISDPTVVSAAG